MNKDGRARVAIHLDLEVDVLTFTSKLTLEDSVRCLVIKLFECGVQRCPVVHGVSARSIHSVQANLCDGPNFNKPSDVNTIDE